MSIHARNSEMRVMEGITEKGKDGPKTYLKTKPRLQVKANVTSNAGFESESREIYKNRKDNKGRHKERTKRRYKDCCWSNGHSSQLVHHIPEKRRKRKRKNRRRIWRKERKRPFYPLVLNRFWVCVFVTYFFLLEICLVKHQNDKL